MDNFANASFAPDLIAVMQDALEGAVSTLPHPILMSPVKHTAHGFPSPRRLIVKFLH
jgi:hypothetical protein